MNTRKTLIQMLLGALCGGLLAGNVMASPSDCGSGGMGPMSERMHEMRGERMKTHHKRLHEELKLSPEQEKAWQKFQESHPVGKRDELRPDRAALEKMSAPERAEKMLEQQKKHQEAMSQHVVVLKAFYEQLTPEQKKTFDDHHRAMPRSKGGRDSGKGGGPAVTSPAKPQ